MVYRRYRVDRTLFRRQPDASPFTPNCEGASVGRVAEWKSARTGTWAKVSPGFEVVVPLLCIPKAQALLVFFLWPAAFAVQHFPVCLTMSEEGGLEEVEESLRAEASCSWRRETIACNCSSWMRCCSSCSCNRWHPSQLFVASSAMLTFYSRPVRSASYGRERSRSSRSVQEAADKVSTMRGRPFWEMRCTRGWVAMKTPVSCL